MNDNDLFGDDEITNEDAVLETAESPRVVEHIHRWAQQCKVVVTRNSRGTNLEIKVTADTPEKIEELTREVRRRLEDIVSGG